MSEPEVALLRIGLIGPLPPPSGGMANQTRQLARLLGAEGVHVETIQVNAPYRPAWVANLRGVRAVARLLPYLRNLWLAAGRVQLFHVMANSGWSWHLYAAPAVWTASIRGIPVVVNYRGGEAEAFFHRSFRWVRPTLARASAIVVPSAFLRRVFGKRSVDTTIVPNIIDLSLFDPKQLRDPDHERTSPSPHIVVTRNLEPIYDVSTALRAFEMIRHQWPSARLTVAGSGPQERELKELASRLGISSAVSFTGRLDNARMASLYEEADVMVNPSLADNMPISILEALAMGVPVVSTNVGGIPDLVEDRITARLVPAGDHCAVAGAVLELLNNPGSAHRLSKAGRELVKQYEWAQVRERLFHVYNSVLEPAVRVHG